MSGQRVPTLESADAMEADVDTGISGVSNSDSLSELGELVLGCDTICQSLVTTLLK